MHQLDTFICTQCHCPFRCHARTATALGGKCWACWWVDDLSASEQSFMLQWMEDQIAGLGMDS